MRTGIVGVASSSGSGPGAPGKVLQISGVAGDTEVTLTWSTPISDGGSPITGYTIEYSSNGGSSWSSTTDSGSPHTVTGLSNTVGYIFRIKAENAIGFGPYSPETATITPYGTPYAATDSATNSTVYPTLVTTSAATVQSFSTLNTVTFTSSSTWTNPYPAGATTGTATLNGSTDAGVLDYVYGTTDGGPYGSTSSSGSLTGLTRDTTYHFKARGTPSDYSVDVSGTVNAGGGSATVSFVYGTTSGGPYPNEIAAAESPVTGSSNTSVSATVTGLSAGTWYFKTKAVNEIGTAYGDEELVVISSGVLLGSQLSFTPPAVKQIIDLDCWGGGGGGTFYVGGGGGGCARATLSSASVSSSVAVTVAAGGSPGADGSATSIASLLTAAGGLAGRGDFDSPNPSYGGASGSGQSGGSGGFSLDAGGGGGGGSNGPGQNGYNLGSYPPFGQTNYVGGNGGDGWSNPYGQGGGGGGAGTDGEGGNGLGSPQGNGPANTGRGGGGVWFIGSTIEVPGSGGSGYAQFKYYGP